MEWQAKELPLWGMEREGPRGGGCAMKFALIAALGVKPEFASPARSAGSEFFCCLSHSRCALSCYNLTDIPGMFGGVAVRGPQEGSASAAHCRIGLRAPTSYIAILCVYTRAQQRGVRSMPT